MQNKVRAWIQSYKTDEFYVLIISNRIYNVKNNYQNYKLKIYLMIISYKLNLKILIN